MTTETSAVPQAPSPDERQRRTAVVQPVVAAACATLLLSSAAGAFAASHGPIDAPNPGGLDVTINQVDATEFPLLRLYVTVLDANGQYVRNLTPDDIAVIEDGTEVPISKLALTGAENLPLTVVVALDISDSMVSNGGLDEARKAAGEFIANLSPSDRAAVVAFASSVTVVNDFTQDKSVIDSSLSALESGGRTALYDAMHTSYNAITEQTGRRAVVLLTDGWEYRASQHSREEALSAARDSGVPAYALGFASADEATLQSLATQTGGRYTYRPESQQISELFRDLQGALTQQFVVEYQSAISSDSKVHTVDVNVGHGDASGTDSRSFLPIPVMTPRAPTPAPLPTASLMPVASSSAAKSISQSALLALAGLALAVLGGLAVILLSRRQPEPSVQVCRDCGRPLDPLTGACAHCQMSDSGPQSDAQQETPIAPAPPLPTVQLAADAPMAWLIVTRGPQKGREIQLTAEKLTVGRAGDNDIVIDSPEVSGYHLRIRRTGDDYVLTDLGTANGTELNDEPIDRCLLKNGDRISFASTTLVFMNVVAPHRPPVSS